MSSIGIRLLPSLLSTSRCRVGGEWKSFDGGIYGSKQLHFLTGTNLSGAYLSAHDSCSDLAPVP